ncbi:MAG TPA: hypothetical protein V6C89_11295 [Drouetiella sp.]
MVNGKSPEHNPEQKATTVAATSDQQPLINSVLQTWKQTVASRSDTTTPGAAPMSGETGQILCAEIVGKSGTSQINLCAEKININDPKSPGDGSHVVTCAEIITSPGLQGTKPGTVDACAENIKLPKDGKPLAPPTVDMCAEQIKLPKDGKPLAPPTVDMCAEQIKLPKDGKPLAPPTVDMCAEQIKLPKDGKPLAPNTVNMCAEHITWPKGGKDGSSTVTCAEHIKLPGDGKEPPSTMVACAEHIKWPDKLKGVTPGKPGDNGSTVNACAEIIDPKHPKDIEVNTCAEIVNPKHPKKAVVDTCSEIIKKSSD